MSNKEFVKAVTTFRTKTTTNEALHILGFDDREIGIINRLSTRQSISVYTLICQSLALMQSTIEPREPISKKEDFND